MSDFLTVMMGLEIIKYMFLIVVVFIDSTEPLRYKVIKNKKSLKGLLIPFGWIWLAYLVIKKSFNELD